MKKSHISMKMVDEKDDLELQELLRVMGPRSKSKSWANDTDGGKAPQLDATIGVELNEGAGEEEDVAEYGLANDISLAKLYKELNLPGTQSRMNEALETTKSLEELDNSMFQGRPLHVMPAQQKKTDEMMFDLFSSFLARFAKLDELVEAAYRFLVGFQQALEFIKPPGIDTSHVVLESLITANSTTHLSSYIEAGCFSPCDIQENISKLHTCHLGLLDHNIKAKNVVKELESILDNAEEVVRADLADLHHLQDNDKSEVITDYAILMTCVFWMVKKDYKMQEKVVSGLSLKSSSEELESYCLMWSLRPFVDNDIIEKAWRYVRR